MPSLQEPNTQTLKPHSPAGADQQGSYSRLGYYRYSTSWNHFLEVPKASLCMRTEPEETEEDRREENRTGTASKFQKNVKLLVLDLQ
jgi:hypothetical protein